MKLNVSKCFLLHYRPRHSTGDFPVYFIDGIPIKREQKTADLGMLIGDDLNFQDQVKKACAKANREINIIRSFKSRSPTFLANMYKMFIRPHMDYCV